MDGVGWGVWGLGFGWVGGRGRVLGGGGGREMVWGADGVWGFGLGWRVGGDAGDGRGKVGGRWDSGRRFLGRG